MCACLNLFWLFFFITVTKPQCIFFLRLLLTSEVARKTPIAQSKRPLASSLSHESSLSPWFDDESTDGAETPLCQQQSPDRQAHSSSQSHRLTLESHRQLLQAVPAERGFLLPCPNHPDQPGWHNYSWGRSRWQRKTHQETDLGFICLVFLLFVWFRGVFYLCRVIFNPR